MTTNDIEVVSSGAGEQVGRIVATVEDHADLLLRLEEANTRLAEAEARIAQLSAAATAIEPKPSRTTLSAGMHSMLTKQTIAAGEMEAPQASAGALDTALSSLSIEQRFAVKAELLRIGAVV